MTFGFGIGKTLIDRWLTTFPDDGIVVGLDDQGGADETRRLVEEAVMRIKVHGGTAAESNTPLCHTCRFASVIRGPGLGDEIIECRRLSDARTRVAFRVTFCTDYNDRRQPSVSEMEEIAWVLKTDAKQRQVGFVPARNVSHLWRHHLDDDD